MTGRILLLHGGVLLALLIAPLAVGDYALLVLTRVMLLAVYATGYNILFGYTGLLSLGHALFFSAGLYGAALPVVEGGLTPLAAFATGVLCGLVLSLVVGLLALRTTGVAFMIVTLMFAQSGYLTIYYFGDYTRGDEGVVLPDSARSFQLAGYSGDFTDPVTRYLIAWTLLALALATTLALVRSRFGRTLVAIRENEPRTRLLGYDTHRLKLAAMVLSGTISATAGAATALLFAYAGASYAGIANSIDPLLWTLVGGAGTVLGPLLGAAIVFLLVDLAGGSATASLLVVGASLIALVLFFPRGILGTLRERGLRWLP